MKKKPNDEGFPDRGGDLEEQIHNTLVEMGLVIPQTAEEVRIAEEAMKNSECRPLPAGLANPSTLFHRLDEPEEARDEPLEGILEAANERGLSPKRLASLTKLSVVLITMFDRGMISTRRLPRIVVSRIAGAIGSTTERVMEYLQAGPRLAPGTNFKADDVPALEEPQSFFEAVKEDPTLSTEEVEYLLSLYAE